MIRPIGNLPRPPGGSFWTRCGVASAMLITVAATAGCDRGSKGNESLLAMLSDAETRTPIQVVEQKPRLEIPLDARQDDNGTIKLETARFLHQFKRTGASKLHVTTPRGVGSTTTALHDVRHLIRSAGIAENTVVYGAHAAGDRSVRITYARLAAVTPVCDGWRENVDLNRDNLPYKQFGCAVQSNVAAMIARPTDVLYPATETARGAERRTSDQKKHTEGTLGADTKSGISTR